MLRCMGCGLLLWAGCWLAIAVVTAGDATTPAYVAILLPEANCACWGGMDAGQTDYKEARNIIAGLPNVAPAMGADTWLVATDKAHQHTLKLLSFETGAFSIAPNDVRLGDILLAMGAPDFQNVRLEIEARQFLGVRRVYLYYMGGSVSVSVRVPDGHPLTPDTPVADVQYHAKPVPQLPDSQPWRGFTQSFAFTVER